MKSNQETFMNIVFFGWIRVRRINSALICLREVWLKDRFSFWERSLDRLPELFDESEVSQPFDH
jgi:hypothetical protein